MPILGVEIEVGTQEPHFHECEQTAHVVSASLEQKERLRDHRIASEHRCGRLFGGIHGPLMTGIVADEQRDEWPGVYEPSLHRP